MRLWRKLPLKYQMVLMALFSSGVALFVAMVLVLFYQRHDRREHKVEELRSAADLIGTNSAAALVFDDEAGGRKVLDALRVRIRIRTGILYRPGGAVFANFCRNSQFQPGRTTDPSGAEKIVWASDSLSLYRPI